jgi:hypothetical protein
MIDSKSNNWSYVGLIFTNAMKAKAILHVAFLTREKDEDEPQA